METTQTNPKYVEWLSAEEMHKGSKEWLSQLEFIKDEHLFFEDLIKTYTLQLLLPKKFAHNKQVIDALNESQKRNDLLIEAVKIHKNELQIMVDGINQIKKEEAYKKDHTVLIIEFSNFLKHYRSLKLELFGIIKNIKKEGKARRLLDRK
jgi:hypothetical protein